MKVDTIVVDMRDVNVESECSMRRRVYGPLTTIIEVTSHITRHIPHTWE